MSFMAAEYILKALNMLVLSLYTYCSSIFKTLSDVLKTAFQPDPVIATVGIAGENNDNLSGSKLSLGLSLPL